MSDYGIDARTFMVTKTIAAALGATTADNYPIILNSPIVGEVRAARYVQQTTLAAGDGTNNRTLAIAKGTAPTFGTTMGTWSGNGNAITADTPISFTMGAAAARRFAVGESVALVATFNGTGGALTADGTVQLFVVMGMFDFAQE